MEDLRKFLKSFETTQKRKPLTNQDKLNEYLITHLCQVVHKRSAGKKEFVLVDEMIPTYYEVFRYLNNDYTLEQQKKHCTIQPWNLNKGIFFIGNFGRGKTLMLDMMYQLRDKLNILGKYMTAYNLSVDFTQDNKKFEQFCNGETNIFLDEIGDEPKETLNYGNAENTTYRAMKLFFDAIEKQSDKKRFFGTSNLGHRELIERYDERIWSRIVGNCNIIVFGSEIKDFRKL